jgi:signal transduction histidine kinase
VRSLRSRLFVVWVLSLLASVAVGVLLVQLYQQSTSALTGRAEATLVQACEQIADRYAYYTAGWAGPEGPRDDVVFRQDLVVVVALALAPMPGVEGGIWQGDDASLAYAFPSYAGSQPRAALPAAERDHIRDINQLAAEADREQSQSYGGGHGTLLLAACPLRGPLPTLTAWTMTRVGEVPGWDRLRLGVGVLLALMLAISAWLSWLVLTWSRHVARIEATLARHDAGAPPYLAPTGERELDRIVAALNAAVARLGQERARSEALAARVALAERLAALGRVAAGVAHEIRNPIAVMRLRAENALAGDVARRGTALQSILEQIARLDRLIGELLAMTQRGEPAPEDVDIAAFLRDCAAEHAAAAVTLRVEAPQGRARFDPAMLRRVLANLLQNAIQHTPAGGSVSLCAERSPTLLRLLVADTGPGVAAELRDRLFEPFVTGRAEGTGLGLAIARELVEAQGGRLTLARAGGEQPGEGAVFAVEIPQETPWPPS